MQQPKKPTTKPKPQRPRGLGLVTNTCVIESKFFETLAQVFKIVTINWVQTAKHHRLWIAVTRESLKRWRQSSCDCFTTSSLRDVFDARDEIAHFTWTKFCHGSWYWTAHADLECLMNIASLHKLHARTCVHAAMHDPNTRHHSSVLIVLRIKNKRLQRSVRIAHWCWNTRDNGVKKFGYTIAGLGRNAQYFFSRNSQNSFDLHCISIRVSRRKIDLVEHSDNLKIVFKSQITVGERLCFNALGCINNKDDAFACRERTAHLVAKVHMPWCVDEVQDMPIPVNANILGLNGDAAFALKVHRVKVLLAHFTSIHRSGEFKDSVGEGRFAVVDVGNNREIPNFREFHGLS